jgi:ubiquinone/menaquinone biosynthesis C-methylase UbiE
VSVLAIDFHDPRHRDSYTSREADESWARLVSQQIDFRGVKAADIGCGGGIYAKKLAELGAEEVVGVDFSQAMLEGAAAHCAAYSGIRFIQGEALQTGLAAAAFDVVLERALIHHLKDEQLAGCFREAYRILKPGGRLLVQDRTPEDILLAGSREHLRGYFFEKFPKLTGTETARRHSSQLVHQALSAAGFSRSTDTKLWETRGVYGSYAEFRSDLLNRTGRSLLHELTDAELSELADYIQLQAGLAMGEGVQEQDRWTIWIAEKN